MQVIRKQPNKKYQKFKIKQLFIMFLIFCFVFSFVLTFGKFISNNIYNFYLKSKEFYFNSDKLSEKGSVFEIDNWSGVDDYTIIINMNSIDNNLKSASYDIGYNVSYTCSNNAICQLSKTSGIIDASSNTDSFTLRITPNTQLNTGDKVVVEIEVASTGNYKKTLKGKFTLVVGQEKLTYQINDSAQSPYIELAFTNTLTYYTVKEAFANYSIGEKIDLDTYLALNENDKSKCYSAIVSIEFDPNDILLDLTDEVYLQATDKKTKSINGNNYISGFSISIEPTSSTNIRFYKTDPSKDYSYPNIDNKSIVKVTNY